MSHNKTPTPDLSRKVSHSFPSLIKDGVDKESNTGGTSHQFRPMFDRGTSAGQLTRSIPNESRQPSQDDPLETATRRGYEMGYAAGCENACELVETDLPPIIDDMQNTLTRYARSGKEIAGIYSVSSLMLALAIVEKITGEVPLFSLEDLSAAQSAINEALMESFGLDLRFNPDDYKLIQTLSLCKHNLDWKTFLQMGISPDDGINAGDIRSVPTPIDWDTIIEQIATALDTSMDNPPE